MTLLPGSEDLRFAVPDSLYATGVVGNFANLQITDSTGRNQPYALCPLHAGEPERIVAPVLAIPDTARPALNTQNQLSLDAPRGARLATNSNDWIIDLRLADAPVRQLDGLPRIRALRSSPNLQQWSAAISYTQTDTSVEFDPLRTPYLRISLATAQEASETPVSVAAHLEKFRNQRARQWFAPAADSNGILINNRQLPVLSARLQNPAEGVAVALQSRQGDWDAWKPRGNLGAGQTDQILTFSAVTDPQWRVQPADAGELMLAHAAYELRIPHVAPTRTLELRVEAKAIFGPQLSCLNTQSMDAQAPKQLMDASAQTAKPSHAPENLRSRFLLLLLLPAGYFGWRFFKSRQDR